MKPLLLTTIAAVLLVGCATTQSPEPPTAKAPDISIYEAAREGNIEAVKQHIAAGTDVNAKDDALEWTPLFMAAGKGHKEIVELLLANGAEVNAKGDGGVTPLHIAPLGSHKEVAELLMAKGADVNAKKDDGEIPLHYAAFVSHKEIVELLIAKGADVNAKDKDDETPLDEAIISMLGLPVGHSEIADLLRKHGGKTGEELKAEGK